MKRITFIIPDLGIGGSEGSLRKTANALVMSKKWEVDIIVYNSRSQPQCQFINDKVNIHQLRPLSSINPILWILICRKLLIIKPNIVFGWSTYANLLTLLISILVPNRWKTAISERNYPPEVFCPSRTGSIRRTVVFFGIKFLYRKSDLVTANSKRTLLFLKKYIGKGPKYIQLVNFLNINFAQKKAEAPLKDAPNFSDQPRILSIGRLVHQKGFDVLLEAIKIVHYRYKWSLLIIGNGPEKEKLISLSNRLNITDSIYWVDTKIDPFPYYGWADIIVVPSRYEGFPNVVLEAMACGKAVICSDCFTGPREMTDGGDVALLFPNENAIALSKLIIQLGQDQHFRHSIGMKAAQHVAIKYDSRIIVPKLLSTFSSI